MSAPLIVGLVIFLLIGGGFTWLGSMPKKKRVALFKNMYVRLYEFLSNFFITQGTARKISRKLSMLSIYRADELPAMTVHLFMVSFFASAALVFVGAVICNDMLSSLLCYLFAAIINGIMINKQLDKTHLKVLKDTAKTLAALEQAYMKHKNIPDALSTAEVGKLLKKAVDEIHTILTGSEGALRLQQFYASMPFRPLQTLAGVCYNLNMFGDTVDSQNISGFVRAITILRGDVNAQIEKFALQKAKFGVMEYLPLVAIIGIGPLESYFVGIIPGVSLMYNSILGYMLRALVIVSAIVAYSVISRINSTSTVKEDDRGGWTKFLLTRRRWRGFLANIIPKDDKKHKKLNAKLKKALSKMSLEHYYTKKAVFAVAAFFSMLLLLYFSSILGKGIIQNSTQQLSLVAGVERDERTQNAMRVMDEVFFEAEGNFSDAELKLLINRYVPGLTDMEQLDEMKRMRDKYDMWKDLYFKYWFVWIAFGAGLLGWGLPAIMIKARASTVKAEMEDDYMQLQTLVGILVYTGLDTLAVLQQMVQQSRVHKDILLHAYHSFPSGPELEMERLRSKISLPDFKWFIDKLKLTICELPMNEAFSDLISERENFMRLRRIAMESSLAKKQMLCSFLAMFPIIAFAIAEFLVPLGVLGVKELMSALSML